VLESEEPFVRFKVVVNVLGEIMESQKVKGMQHSIPTRSVRAPLDSFVSCRYGLSFLR